jgi:DHA2 family multidrug resistance protein
LGLFGFGLGTLINGNLTHEAGYWEFFWPQALRGFCLMFCFLPINYLTFGTLPPEEVKNASGLYNLMRNLGGAIGLAVANTLMIRLNKEHYAILREAVKPGSTTAQALLGSLQERFSYASLPDSDLAALKQVYGLVRREAEVLTINTLFNILALIFFLALLLIPLIRMAPAASGAAGGRR